MQMHDLHHMQQQMQFQQQQQMQRAMMEQQMNYDLVQERIFNWIIIYAPHRRVDTIRYIVRLDSTLYLSYGPYDIVF